VLTLLRGTFPLDRFYKSALFLADLIPFYPLLSTLILPQACRTSLPLKETQVCYWYSKKIRCSGNSTASCGAPKILRAQIGLTQLEGLLNLVAHSALNSGRNFYPQNSLALEKEDPRLPSLWFRHELNKWGQLLSLGLQSAFRGPLQRLHVDWRFRNLSKSSYNCSTPQLFWRFKS